MLVICKVLCSLGKYVCESEHHLKDNEYTITTVESDYVSFYAQGNPPLDIPTRESREKSWAKKKSLEFYIFADNVDDRKRSDAAIFYVSICCVVTYCVQSNNITLIGTNGSHSICHCV